jgi:hypothetical protein
MATTMCDMLIRSMIEVYQLLAFACFLLSLFFDPENGGSMSLQI